MNETNEYSDVVQPALKQVGADMSDKIRRQLESIKTMDQYPAINQQKIKQMRQAKVDDYAAKRFPESSRSSNERQPGKLISDALYTFGDTVTGGFMSQSNKLYNLIASDGDLNLYHRMNEETVREFEPEGPAGVVADTAASIAGMIVPFGTMASAGKALSGTSFLSKIPGVAPAVSVASKIPGATFGLATMPGSVQRAAASLEDPNVSYSRAAFNLAASVGTETIIGALFPAFNNIKNPLLRVTAAATGLDIVRNIGGKITGDNEVGYSSFDDMANLTGTLVGGAATAEDKKRFTQMLTGNIIDMVFTWKYNPSERAKAETAVGKQVVKEAEFIADKALSVEEATDTAKVVDEIKPPVVVSGTSISDVENAKPIVGNYTAKYAVKSVATMDEFKLLIGDEKADYSKMLGAADLENKVIHLNEANINAYVEAQVITNPTLNPVVFKDFMTKVAMQHEEAHLDNVLLSIGATKEQLKELEKINTKNTKIKIKQFIENNTTKPVVDGEVPTKQFLNLDTPLDYKQETSGIKLTITDVEGRESEIYSPEMSILLDQTYTRRDFGQQKANETKTKTERGFIDKLLNNVTNASHSLLTEISKLYDKGGREVENLWANQKGASPRATMYFKELEKDIYTLPDGQPMSREQESVLDQIMSAKNDVGVADRTPGFKTEVPLIGLRQIANLYDSKGASLTLPNGVKVNIDDIKPAMDKYFKHMRTIPAMLEAEGILEPGEAKTLTEKVPFYMMRRFAQFITEQERRLVEPVTKLNPDTDKIIRSGGGKQLRVEEIIQEIDKGGVELFRDMDSRSILHDLTQKVERTISANRANRSLGHLAINLKNSGMKEEDSFFKYIERPNDTRIDSNYSRQLYYEDGKARAVDIDKSLASQWGPRDKAEMNRYVGFFSKLLMTKPMKAIAVAFNPIFALRNIPRDAMKTYLTANWYNPVTKTFESVYSSNPAVFMKEISADIAAVWSDVYHKTGQYRDGIVDGIGMDLMTTQGRTSEGQRSAPRKVADFFKIPDKVSDAVEVKLRKIGDIASTPSEFSEMVVRTAVRRAVIRKGGSRAEATAVARKLQDHSVSGHVIDGIEPIIPFMRAAMAGLRSYGIAAKENPKAFAARVGIAMGASMALRLYSQSTDPEGMDDVPDAIVDNNFVIMTGKHKYDKKGRRVATYLTIPKDQVMRPVFSLMENITDIVAGKKPKNWAGVTKNIIGTIHISDQANLAPMFRAMLGAALNYDIWRDKPIWNGVPVDKMLEFKDSTSALARLAGEVAGKVPGDSILQSPERLQYIAEQFFPQSNPLVAAFALTGNKVIEQLAPEFKPSIEKEYSMNDVPGLKTYYRQTSPGFSVFRAADTEQTKFNSMLTQHKLELTQLVADGNYDKGYEYIRKVDNPDVQSLLVSNLTSLAQMQNGVTPNNWITGRLKRMSVVPRSLLVSQLRTRYSKDVEFARRSGSPELVRSALNTQQQFESDIRNLKLSNIRYEEEE